MAEGGTCRLRRPWRPAAAPARVREEDPHDFAGPVGPLSRSCRSAAAHGCLSACRHLAVPGSAPALTERLAAPLGPFAPYGTGCPLWGHRVPISPLGQPWTPLGGHTLRTRIRPGALGPLSWATPPDPSGRRSRQARGACVHAVRELPAQGRAVHLPFTGPRVFAISLPASSGLAIARSIGHWQCLPQQQGEGRKAGTGHCRST